MKIDRVQSVQIPPTAFDSGELHRNEVDLPDPEPLRNVSLGVEKVRDVAGDFNIAAASPLHVRQGDLGDCFIAGTVASIFDSCKEVLESVIWSNGNGTYTVRLHDTEKVAGAWKPTGQSRDVVVDRDFYVRWGQKMFGGTYFDPDHPDQNQQHLLFPLIEKALALDAGGYGSLDDGGCVQGLMASLLGRSGVACTLDALAPLCQQHGGSVGDYLRHVRDDLHSPLCAGTAAVIDENSGLSPRHCYAVLGCSKDPEGHETVRLLDPTRLREWGADGKVDGVFSMPLSEFLRHFDQIAHCT